MRSGVSGHVAHLHLLPHDKSLTFRSLSCFLHTFRLPVLKSFQTSSVLRNSTFNRSICHHVTNLCLKKWSHNPLAKAVSPRPRLWTQSGLPLIPVRVSARSL